MFTVSENENLPGMPFEDLESAMAYAQSAAMPVVVAMDNMIIAHVAPQAIKPLVNQIIDWTQDLFEHLGYLDIDVRETKLNKTDAWHFEKKGGHYLRIRYNAHCLQYRSENGYWDYESVFNRVTKHLGYRPFGMTAVRLIALHEIAHIMMQIEYSRSQGHNDRWLNKFIELVDMYLGWKGQ